MDLLSRQKTFAIQVDHPIRIFLVDDSAHFLKVTINLLNADPRFEVIGIALSGREALAQMAQLQPDLVLMDVAMPDISGLELTRHLKRKSDAPRVVIMTMYEEPGYRLAAELVKADGFVPKANIAHELPTLINTLFHLAGPDSPAHYHNAC
jgi:DNA-binding NarL/FixJ family response regulator